MPVADRIRGQNTSLAVVVDNRLQGGSFTKVENFKWSPLQDVTASSFLGESEDEFDVQHHGFEVSFTIHEADNSPVDAVLQKIIAANAAGTPLPNVQLVFTKEYRDPSLPAKSLVFQNVKLKMDSQDPSDRKGFVKTAFSGKCRKMEVL